MGKIVGSDFVSSKPASVAFDLHLAEVKKGRLLWSAEFNKIQQALTENILDIRCMTAEKADIGSSK